MMVMAKISPTPWELNLKKPLIFGADGIPLAEILKPEVGSAVLNGLAMVAAPEMIDALKECVFEAKRLNAYAGEVVFNPTALGLALSALKKAGAL